MDKRYMLAALILGVLALAACQSSSPTGNTVIDNPSAVKELKVDAFNFGFTQSPIEIKKGDKVRLTLTSTSGVHGIAIPDFGVSTGAVAPGESKSVEFTADKAGTFAFKCNVPCGPGHKGMTGQIVVTE